MNALTSLIVNAPRLQKFVTVAFMLLMLSLFLLMAAGVVSAGSALSSGSYCAC